MVLLSDLIDDFKHVSCMEVPIRSANFGVIYLSKVQTSQVSKIVPEFELLVTERIVVAARECKYACVGGRAVKILGWFQNV